MKPVYKKYFKNLPHIWCPGCGNGIVMSAFARAMEKLGYDKNDTVGISGIGCSSRITGYLDLNTIHTAHGRALAFATGVKVSSPEKAVFVFSGDGDCAAIGGNHFIHACRRNLDLTLIVINNNIYGMTGGQFSPLTPFGKFATTAPYGSIDRSFDLVELAKAAGATFIARGDIYHANQLTDLIVAGAKHKGFSVIEVLSTCPVSYGRKNGLPTPVDMLDYLKKNTVNIRAAGVMTEEDLKDKHVVGIHKDVDEAEYTELCQQLIDRLQRGENDGK